MSSILPHWLTTPLLFFLYIFAIPPGWFGRIRKSVHSKPLNTSHLSSPHRYSLLQIPNSKPSNSNKVRFNKPRASSLTEGWWIYSYTSKAIQLFHRTVSFNIRSLWEDKRQLSKWSKEDEASLQSKTERESSTEENKHANPQQIGSELKSTML